MSKHKIQVKINKDDKWTDDFHTISVHSCKLNKRVDIYDFRLVDDSEECEGGCQSWDVGGNCDDCGVLPSQKHKIDCKSWIFKPSEECKHSGCKGGCKNQYEKTCESCNIPEAICDCIEVKPSKIEIADYVDIEEPAFNFIVENRNLIRELQKAINHLNTK